MDYYNSYNDNYDLVADCKKLKAKLSYKRVVIVDDEEKAMRKDKDEIEIIVGSNDSKSKRWSKAKEIIKWIADKGVDVGISLLPLLLKIS